MKKKLLSVVLALAMVLSLMPMVWASAASPAKLPTPQVTWVTQDNTEIGGKTWKAGELVFTWNETVSAANYRVAIKDAAGNVADTYEDGLEGDSNQFVNRVFVGWYADQQLSTGTYTAEVTLLGDGTTCSDSDVGKSAPYSYTAPANACPTPTNLTWQEGVPTFEIPGESQSQNPLVFVEFGIENNSSIKGCGYRGSQLGDPRPLLDRLTKLVNRHGEGNYYFRVRSISTDILAHQHSPWSNWSAPHF